ncbi:hypothetical protein D9M68_543830 [compost metagenome]
MVAGANSDSFSPARPTMSEASAAVPPEKLYTASCSLPVGLRRDSSEATSISSSMSSTSMMPSWLNTALLISAEPAMAAVCDCAALAPYSDLPTLIATIGLPHRAACSAAAMKRGPLRTPSSVVTITSMSGASAM